MHKGLLCKVIKFPQEKLKGEVQLPSLCIGTPELGLRYTDIKFSYLETKYYHLYLISNRKIKQDDKCLDPEGGQLPLVFTCKENLEDEQDVIIDTEGKVRYTNCDPHQVYRIEASTDKSLGLPLIPQSFVKEYTQKQGKIDKVYLKLCNGDILLHMDEGGYPSNGEVIILPIKDNWNREELREITRLAYNLGVLAKTQEFDEWFEENY